MACAEEIAAYLAAYNAGALGLTVATNLHTRPFPVTAAVDPAVAIHVFGGRPSERAFGDGPIMEHPHFHVFVRGAKDGDAAGDALAQQVYKALDAATWPQTLSGTVYRDIRSIGGPPAFLSRDEAGQRSIFVMTFEADKDRSA